MSRLLLLALFCCGLVLSCERFDKHVQKFCTFAGENKPCIKPNAESFASKCCSSAGKCSSVEFPLNSVCCFTQDCLDRCYPGRGHKVGAVY